MFWLIDTIIVRPIVNILFVIYDLVGDFGLAIIIFTVLVKLLMWPLVKRQLHQTKLMRKIQPELAEIKKNCKGNRQMESLQMMDLYKRNNIKPFRTVLTTLIQLPIFLALFMAISAMVNPRPSADTCGYTNIANCAYEPVRNMSRINDLAGKQDSYLAAVADSQNNQNNQNSQNNNTENNNGSNNENNENNNENNSGNNSENNNENKAENKTENTQPTYEFEPKLFGLVDLSARPADVFQGKFNVSTIVIMLFAISASLLQYFASKQLNPSNKTKKSKSFRQLMKEAAAGDGKEPDQAEISAMATSRMTAFMPIMMFFIMLYLPGALVFYYLLSSATSIVQQKIALGQAENEMEASADKAVLKELRKIKEAEVVENKKTGTKITRISAKDSKKKRRKK